MDSKPVPQDTQASAAGEAVELSEREREILVLVAGGASNKEVAQQLVISPNTVKVHLRNIFGKIGVASRTEAALYAVRAGLIKVAAPTEAENELPNGVSALEASAESDTIHVPPQPSIPSPAAVVPARRTPLALWVTLAVLLTALLTVVLIVQLRPAASPASTATVPTSLPRWQVRSALPEARRHLAIATLDNLVYVIGGETVEGVSSATARYDPNDQTWQSLADKPAAVADVNAAVVGGLIYVPGGRLASGAITTTLEAYDPARDRWITKAPLPVPLSGYALAELEGQLYVFGGWNGSDYVASVFQYDPNDDAWSERTRMPTARGFAAAAAIGGTIYVIGGTDGQQPLNLMETYAPSRDSATANPWSAGTPLPASPASLSATTIADSLYVVAGDETGSSFMAWAFRPDKTQWEPLETASDFSPSWVGAVALQTQLYVIGNDEADTASSRLLTYQALFTTIFPVVTGG